MIGHFGVEGKFHECVNLVIQFSSRALYMHYLSFKCVMDISCVRLQFTFVNEARYTMYMLTTMKSSRKRKI